MENQNNPFLEAHAVVALIEILIELTPQDVKKFAVANSDIFIPFQRREDALALIENEKLIVVSVGDLENFKSKSIHPNFDAMMREPTSAAAAETRLWQKIARLEAYIHQTSTYESRRWWEYYAKNHRSAPHWLEKVLERLARLRMEIRDLCPWLDPEPDYFLLLGHEFHAHPNPRHMIDIIIGEMRRYLLRIDDGEDDTRIYPVD